MDRNGSSYLLQDFAPIHLIGIVGASTPADARGTVKLTFAQQTEVFVAELGELRCKIIVKWDIAVRLIALIHILLIQNCIIRGTRLDLRISPDRVRVFNVTGGRRTTSIEFSWSADALDVKCGLSPDGGPHDFELLLGEEAAAELVSALAEQIANNGTAMNVAATTK